MKNCCEYFSTEKLLLRKIDDIRFSFLFLDYWVNLSVFNQTEHRKDWAFNSFDNRDKVFSFQGTSNIFN